MSYLRRMHRVNIEAPKTVSLGINNTKRLYDLVGLPLKDTPIIHVGGTNGKGSVCIKLASAIHSAGLRTGLFVSPSISSFKERIQINNKLLQEEDMCNILTELFSLCEKHNISASFFELTTILAMLNFERNKCDAVVLEVGLGGRLDATNIIKHPALSIITCVQNDHSRILGNTISKIAYEKAGIMKDGCPVLIGENKEDIQNVFYSYAKDHHVSSIKHLNDVLDKSDIRYDPKSNSINSSIDILNGDLALAALKLLKTEDISTQFTFKQPLPSQKWIDNYHKLTNSLKLYDIDKMEDVVYNSRPPCRFEVITASSDSDSAFFHNVDVILDVAHNEDAIRELCNTLKMWLKAKHKKNYEYDDIHVVIGMSNDKDFRSCASHLVDLVSPQKALTNIHCIHTGNKRGLSQEELQKILNEISIEKSASTSIASVDSAASTGGNRTSTTRAESDADFENGIENKEDNARKTLKEVITNASLNATTQRRPVVLVCGSAFIMSIVRDAFNMKQHPIDDPIEP